jgi:hypothetical protein
MPVFLVAKCGSPHAQYLRYLKGIARIQSAGSHRLNGVGLEASFGTRIRAITLPGEG